jgi:putative endonuclease
VLGPTDPRHGGVMKTAFVYILTNGNNSVLYSGSTTSLKKRIYHHRNKMIPEFSKKYFLQKLVYFEACPDKNTALKREIQLKKGSRKSKLALIDNFNPQWIDLYDQLE